MRTKIKFYAIFLIVSSVCANAQLKVRTDGSVWQGYSGYSNLWLGTYPNGGINNGQWGIEVWNGALNIWKPWPSPNAGNYHLYIAENGNVGIGKVPSASAKLDVNGSIAIYGAVMLSSDERLKKDITPLTGKTINLYKLNAKSYKKHQPDDELSMPEQRDEHGNLRPGKISKSDKKMRKTQKETTEYGFLAQELKEIYPDLVSQDTLGYYLVDYIGLIPIMVESLKEQKAQIDALSALVNKSSSGPKKVGASNTTDITETDALTYPVLEQNIPNPFTANTQINYYLPTTTNAAAIYVYDMNGIQLKSYSVSEMGKGNITIQGSEFNAGMYLYTLIADGKVLDTKRMILTK